jgi:AAA domain
MARFSCLDVMSATGLAGKRIGKEERFTCPNHSDQHPSLSINPDKDVWACPPCGPDAKGKGWKLASFISGIDANDKPAMSAWLKEHGLINNGNGNGDHFPQICAEYRYEDENGVHLYDVVRFTPKTFRIRRPNGEWGLDGVRRVLYRLPEIVAAEGIFICEGEKDFDRLVQLGFKATTNPAGAGKWRNEYSESFPFYAEVVILPDNDEIGRQHAQDVARSLHDRVASVKVVNLPGLPAKGDVYDWLDGKDDEIAAAEELAQICENTPAWKPSIPIDAEEVLEIPEEVLDENIDAAPGAGLRVITGEELLTMEFPPRTFLLDPIIPTASLNMVHSWRGTGKTNFVLGIAVAVASGGSFLRWTASNIVRRLNN